MQQQLAATVSLANQRQVVHQAHGVWAAPAAGPQVASTLEGNLLHLGARPHQVDPMALESMQLQTPPGFHQQLAPHPVDFLAALLVVHLGSPLPLARARAWRRLVCQGGLEGYLEV